MECNSPYVARSLRVLLSFNSILPFCVFGVSGFGTSAADITRSKPNDAGAAWLIGTHIVGSRVFRMACDVRRRRGCNRIVYTTVLCILPADQPLTETAGRLPSCNKPETCGYSLDCVRAATRGATALPCV